MQDIVRIMREYVFISPLADILDKAALALKS